MEFKSTRITLAMILLISLGVVSYLFWPHQPNKKPSKPLHLPVQQKKMPINQSATTKTEQIIHIQAGDSMARLFRKHAIPYSQAIEILKLKPARKYLTHLQPNQTLSFNINPQREITSLKYFIDNQTTLLITRINHQLHAEIIKVPTQKALSFASGTIKSSLLQATSQAGLDPNLQQQLQKIFEGSINFKHDLRAGDQFDIIYNQYYVDGKPDHSGNILLAQLITHNKTYSAIRYTYPKNHTGYYTPNGHGVTPLFLKAPLKYKRISSYFSYARMDPYLKKIRPHYGVDYAAPIGTPIHSVGNGKIIFCAKDHGYGNAIIIRYSKKYEAIYAHLHHFAKGMHSGVLVKKGQLIGYVGSTGWSTGPHLHFGWYVNGVPKDPLKRPFLFSPPIPKNYQSAYLQYAHQLFSQLRIFKH